MKTYEWASLILSIAAVAISVTLPLYALSLEARQSEITNLILGLAELSS